MKNSTILLYFLFICTSVFAQTENLLKSWDSKIYNPTDSNLKSFSCEARVNGLTETLKSALFIPNINSVFFKISWDAKNQFTIKIVGLPQGFNEIKNSLELTMVDKLRFFIPTKIYEPLADYDLKINKVDSGLQYSLEDKSYLKNITQIQVFFDGSNNLSKMELKGPNLKENNTFTYTQLEDTQKMVLKNLLVESIGAQGIFAMSYAINYNKVGNFHFPKSISITSQLQSLPGEKGQKQIFTDSKYQINFSNFLVK